MNSNVAARQTQVVRLLIGVFGLGVMAASVPGVTHHVLEDGHGTTAMTALSVASIATRIFGSQSWRRGSLLVDFPVVQCSGGLLPWLASIWVDDPWKLGRWALGVGAGRGPGPGGGPGPVRSSAPDLVQERISARVLRPGRQRPRARAGRDAPEIRAVSVDPAHVAEHLGLFVIIVLGESVLLVVAAAGKAAPDLRLLATVAASFVLLAGLFGLSVVFGRAGLPHLRAGRIPTRAALGLHCLVIGVVAAVAMPLSAVVEHGSDPLSSGQRWLLCGAVATYVTLGVTPASPVAARTWSEPSPGW